jgi:putative MATE family efflux protein
MSVSSAQRGAHSSPAPRFVTGSLLRHILVMTSAGAVGLMAIFFGDLANIFFLGLLRDIEILAAIGYASSILFFTTSVGIGLAIATTALVSPALGAREVERARRLSAHAHIFTALAATALILVMWPTLPRLLAWLGAEGRPLALAHRYLQIVLPSLPLLASGMCSSAVLRSLGDARRAMYITLLGAAVNTALDPVFIFWFGLGIDGAAIASVLARAAILCIGLWGVMGVHGLISRPNFAVFGSDAALIARFAVPAVLANIATPVSNAYVTAVIARFGDGAVAGWAVIGRLMPVAFGAIFALSGAIGPIIGQNFGARDFARVRHSLTDALKVAAGFTTASWLVLFLAAPGLVRVFNATGDAAFLIVFFCRWLSPLFVFFGMLFVANAACNTLGRPHYATALNWGRATLGTIPFVVAGAEWGQAPGVLFGNMLGGVAFGVGAVILCYRLIARIEDEVGNSALPRPPLPKASE